MKKGTKKTGNTSQLVRDYAAQNPGLEQAQIVKDLVAQGHKVYPALVSQALRSIKGGKKPKAAKRGRKPGSGRTAKARVNAGVGELNIESIKAAANFIKLCGSAEAAIAAIRTFEKISELLK